MRELRSGTALPLFLECFRPAATLLFHRTMRRYQDFKAWQLARELHRKVISMTSTGPASRDFKFRDNLRDAADSAQRNFPEDSAGLHRPILRISSITRERHCWRSRTASAKGTTAGISRKKTASKPTRWRAVR